MKIFKTVISFTLIFVLVLGSAFLLIPVSSKNTCLANQTKNSNSSYFKTEDSNIYYEEYNPSSNNTVLFIHGFNGSTYSWNKLMPIFVNNGYRVVAVDLVGNGFSDKGYEFDHSQAKQAERVVELLNHLQIQDFSIVAHSAGSGTAIKIDLSEEDRVEKVFFVGGFVQIGEQGSKISIFDNYFVKKFAKTVLDELISKDIVLSVLKTAYSEYYNVTDNDINSYYEQITNCDWSGSLLAQVRDNPLNNINSLINANKYFYIWGENDTWVNKEMAYDIINKLSISQYVQIEQAGHLMMEEKPLEVFKIIEANLF